jgi:crotonobetainyl-CoA:carnitine CoA-transferase CaiB-like acyl-CoA transferase
MTNLHPLAGLKILDLSRVLAGPIATQILADLGATVIKIERPGTGDDTRAWGPPFLKDRDGRDTRDSAYYLCANRGKDTLEVDISRPEGQAVIHDYLATSDVLVENFKVGNLAKYGLGYDQLKDRYPKLIYCSITGFGQTGPLASEPGYDFIAQAMGGFMSVTGPVGGPPTKAGVAVSDYVTGLYAVIGILSAVHGRAATGRGTHVDLALLDCTIAMMTNVAQYYLTSGHTTPRVGNAHPTIVPYQEFPTRDGHVIVAVGNDHQFRIFSGVIGLDVLADDPRFATNAARVENRAALTALINDVMKTRTANDWVGALRAADVPVGPILTMDQVFQEPQVIARNMVINVDHPASDTPIKLVGSPIKMI